MKRNILTVSFLIVLNLIVYSNFQGANIAKENISKESTSITDDYSNTYKKVEEKKLILEEKTPKQKTYTTKENSKEISTQKHDSPSTNEQTLNASDLEGDQKKNVDSNESSINNSMINTQNTGFNFKNYHFDLSGFSGNGHVPQNTPYVYQWLDDPSHYLFERVSAAGNAVWSIKIGDQVTIEGNTYTVFKIENGMNNDSNLYDHMKAQNATVTWQTCDTSTDDSTLSIWYAR